MKGLEAPESVTREVDGDDALTFMNRIMSGQSQDAYYLYEPWDPLTTYSGFYPESVRGFQESYHLDPGRFRLALAGNRVGKTLMSAYECAIMISGEIPHALRVPKGTVLDIPRPWEDEGPLSLGILNRARFGFLDPATGTWSPPAKQQDAEPLESHTKDAPCGRVTGVGVYPPAKLAQGRYRSCWICTWKSVRDTRWIKLLGTLLPKHLLNTTRNAFGYSYQDEKFTLTNGNDIQFITYEQGASRAQGAGVHAVFLDEEPKDRKFFTEVDQRLIDAGFAGFMSISYTPLFGFSWSYHDLVLPAAQQGLKSPIHLFHATQYDSPYVPDAVVDERKARYKPWEISARVYGIPAEVAGRPVFDHAKLHGTEETPGWLQLFRVVPRRVRIYVLPEVQAASVQDILAAPALAVPVDRSPESAMFTEDDRSAEDWEMYEDERDPRAAYFISCDAAEGRNLASSEQSVSLDRSTAFVFRTGYPDRTDARWPTLVASLRTGLATPVFGRLVLYAARYFNNALIVPEVRGEAGATLAAEIRDWPFIYVGTVINDMTKKPMAHWGFDTTSRTRNMLWDIVVEFVNDHEHPDSMKCRKLLEECAAACISSKGRPDHPRNGTSDSIVGFGIGLYAYRFARSQLDADRSMAYPGKVAALDNVGDERSRKFMASLEQRYHPTKAITPMLRGDYGGFRAMAGARR